MAPKKVHFGGYSLDAPRIPADEKKANLKFAEVITNCSKFCCKATHKGSEGFGPLQEDLAPESL